MCFIQNITWFCYDSLDQMIATNDWTYQEIHMMNCIFSQNYYDLSLIKQHQTRDRNYQAMDEAMKIRTIQEIERQNQTVRNSRTGSVHRTTRPRLIDWTEELPAQPRTASVPRRPVQPHPPQCASPRIQTEVLDEDGMRVVDTTIPVSEVSPK